MSATSEDWQYRLLVESVTDYAIYMLDYNGLVTTWNPGAERFKGYQASEIIGRHFSVFYTDEDRQAGLPVRALETAARAGKFESEGWRVRKDGTRFWASVVVDAVHDEKGALVGFAKVTRDITEKRALDQAREALFQAQKMESLGQLTGGIAHDFNNLLMAILSSLQLLRKRLPDERKINALIENAFQGAQRGVSLTQRMLAFARRQDLKLEPVALPALVHGMTDLIQRSLGPSITMEARFSLSLSSVLGDANQLESALLNLVVNARDAMPGGGTIAIAGREESVTSSRNHLRDGRYVCLSVTDTGEGMDEATLSRATEPFFTTKGVGKGTGLGLPMVRGLMEQSGGQVVLKSRKGAGTTVELWLPVAKRDTVLDHQASAQTPVKAMRPLVVLAVDDDGLILLNLTSMLEDMGHTVLAANSGKEALGILRGEKTVDLVITDQGMPNMTGLQLAEAIHAEWPNLKIILATGYAELPADAARSARKLAKPFFEGDLAKAIDDAIQNEEAMSCVH